MSFIKYRKGVYICWESNLWMPQQPKFVEPTLNIAFYPNFRLSRRFSQILSDTTQNVVISFGE